jgi:histidine kinase (EC 2.7.13.3)
MMTCIDVDKVKRKALEKGIITQDRLEKMTEKEVISLIFHRGFLRRTKFLRYRVEA